MQVVRRNDWTPRVDLLPLIDVVFLLLTFFIYSLVLMVRADVLPVQISPVGSAVAAEPGRFVTITIDRHGDFYLDRQAIPAQALDARLAELAADPDRPRLFVALEAEAQIDRAPQLVHLIERLRAAGIDDMAIVGPPPPPEATPPPAQPPAE